MTSVLLHFFDIWQPGYGGSTVRIYEAGTTTLADVYTDPGLTAAAANPQTLASLTQDGITYGKWSAPLYVGVSVELQIDSIDSTGRITVPLTDLDGVDASGALVTATGASEARSLADIVARVIHAEDYGDLDSASSATNNATLTAAIGAAAANGGGEVIIPAGTWPFTALSVTDGVLLRGQGRGVTTLQSQTGDEVITLAGDQSGLASLTLDGVIKTTNSVGVYAKAIDETRFIDVEIKRFITGLHCRGGRRADWQNLYIEDCSIGAKLHGDDDSDDLGDAFIYNRWTGGRVTNCTSYGVDFSFEDRECWHNAIHDVGFEDNTGTAIRINGARYIHFDGCWWEGNTDDLEVLDDTDATPASRELNTVIGLFIENGRMEGGECTFQDTCQDVVFKRMSFADVDLTLVNPDNNILAQDCIEDANVSLSGTATRWIRGTTVNNGASAGLTTDATVTKSWSKELAPGQIVYVEGIAIGNQRNGTNRAKYHKVAVFARPGATLAYDNQTANFTVGQILTGATSGATARITADSDGGDTGTLTLRDITGEFEDNEIITDAVGGSATANGTLSLSNVAVIGDVETIGTDREDVAGWDATFTANGPEIEFRVTGAASTTIEWTTFVKVTET